MRRRGVLEPLNPSRGWVNNRRGGSWLFGDNVHQGVEFFAAHTAQSGKVGTAAMVASTVQRWSRSRTKSADQHDSGAVWISAQVTGQLTRSE